MDKDYILKNYESILENTNRSRSGLLMTSSPPPRKVKKVNKKVLFLINQIYKDSIEAKVLCNKDMEYCGCMIELEKNFYIITRKDVSLFRKSRILKSFRRSNSNKITAKECFTNILSHEYGHKLFRELIAPNFFNKDYPLELNKFLISQESTEGFAFWFADNITNLKSPLDELFPSYNRDIKFYKVMQIYERLNEISRQKGKDFVFNSDNLIEFFSGYN